MFLLSGVQHSLRPLPITRTCAPIPAPISALAYTNKAVIYRLLFQATTQTLLTIAADPKHLGVCFGSTSVHRSLPGRHRASKGRHRPLPGIENHGCKPRLPRPGVCFL